jgi:uncharacterized NAD(P)/FAD-binding protein YdhS
MPDSDASLSQPASVAVIGGGFSGTMTAVNLARLSKKPLNLTIINHHSPTSRGVAYGTRRRELLLNVAARNMSAFPDLPDHFLQWLRTRWEFDLVPESELREKFIPRAIYGDYVSGLAQHHLRSPVVADVTTTFIQGEAVDILPEEKGARIVLADGGQVKADRVVLATGNEPPAELPGVADLRDHPAWIGNPWQSWHDRLPPSGGTIVILGTGLTTVDEIITLGTLGWQGVVHAVSRHGWLPASHFRGIEYPDFPPPGVDLADLGLKKLIELLEQHCARLREMGANPAIIVDKMRPYTQRVWQRFTTEERIEFARHHSARWNILRHRIAPELYAQLTTAQLTGRLQIHAASIESVKANGDKLCVHLSGGESLMGDLVINATGPHTKFSATSSVLLQNLIRRGLVTSDLCDMGVRVDPDHTIVGPDGRRSKVLLALGPLIKGTLWETIAVPELRGQARRVAETILDHTGTSVESQPVIEYMI